MLASAGGSGRRSDGASMIWNVRLHDVVGSRWVGTVEGRDEQDARHAAISKFNIPSLVEFDVTPR